MVTDERTPVTVADDLPPHLRGRVKALIYDLSNNDLPMALLDLTHLYRALATKPGRHMQPMSPLRSDESVQTVIYNDDRSAIENICEGPDHTGTCPRATAGHPAACAGKWITAHGWDFKVAPDVGGCPLTALGIVRRYLQATVTEEP